MDLERVAALHRLGVLDGPREERFERITRVVARVLQVPIALISLVDTDRQWFRACIGLDVLQTPRDVSFCGHAILGSGIFVVEDARADPRFADNPLVTGPPHAVFYAGRPLRTAEGAVVGTLCTIDHRPRSLTEGELATLDDLAGWAERELSSITLERALVQADQGHRSFTAALDLQCIAGFDGYFKRLNPSWARVLGRTDEELMSRPFVDFIHPDDRAATEAEAAKIATGATTLRFLNRYSTKDGEWRWLDWSATPALEQQLIYASARDVTEERALAAKLEESEQRHRTILDTTEDVVLSADDAGQITSANRAAMRLLGWSPVALVGRSLVEVLPSLGSSPGLEATLEAIRSRPREMQARAADGREVPVELAVSRGEADDHFYACALRDLSERKRTEQIKGDFVSTVSHELRTPLTSIRGSLGILMGGVVGEVPPKAKAMLQIAHQNVERLVRLINDILDVEKITSGKLSVTVGLVSVPELIRASLEATAGMAALHGVRLETDGVVPDARVLVDKDRMLQVLANLHSNAIKFSPAGSVVLTGVALTANGRLRIWVADRGPGIPVEFRPRVFERFAQASTGTARGTGGSGLGLSITKAIVERHGGSITFTCPEEGGTRFEFELPPAQNRSQNPKSRVALVGTDLSGIAERALVSAGYTIARYVEGAPSPDADLVVVDIGSPDDARLLEFARHLSQPVPTLLVGAGPALAASTAGLTPGLVLYAPTPVPEDALADAVRRNVPSSGRARILHIEDDPDVREVVRALLSAEAEVSGASSLAAARQMVADRRPDLIVLDLALPDGCGLTLLEDPGIANIPVVVFSARDVRPTDGYMVSAALLKTRVSNEDILAAVRNALRGLGESDHGG